MSRLEYLNSFLTERLMAVAGEIFEVFKDTVSEYQGEIARVVEENRCLRKTIADIHTSTAQPRADSRTSSVDGVKEHGSNPEPLDSEPSVIQVKLELATLKQECEPQSSLNNPYTCTSDLENSTCSSEPAPGLSDKPVVLDENEDRGRHSDPGLSVKAETARYRAFSSGTTSSAEPQTGEDVDLQAGDEQTNMACSYCGRIFEEASQLASHLQGHMVMFSCEECGKPCKTKGALRTHMIVHQKERPFSCTLCGKAYSCAKVLNVHLISHTGERPFGCGYCEKRFKLKSHLKEHERIHTGEKPFCCPVCRRGFSRSNAMKIHLRTHHRDQLQFSLNQ
ncbi:oocyte zinc finger protein XlCOF6-like [Astyanax mexicanus]|uniref:Oocyte zinc finger protein XlCOF6-like n=1 Tax=Astyanax mexicanus TaxID=7994 RepID=A0A8B9JK36_ASTMX|nr:oocyte zinc finger protein XlCOF6-like [Astyanax mexicanus]